MTLWHLFHAFNAIDQTAYMAALKKHHKAACTSLQTMKTWMFKTCRRHYN